MSNPCEVPQTPSRGSVPWPRWFLLGLPPFLCFGLMNTVRIIPAGPEGMWIAWLICIVSLAIGVSAALIVSQILGNASRLSQVVLSCVQIPAVFVVWQQTVQLLVTSWR